MSMRKIAFAVVALLFTASIVSAHQSAPPAASPAPTVNVTGTWNGTLTPSVDGQPQGAQPGLLILKQDGLAVTGTAGPSDAQQLAIAKGKIATTKDGTVLTFEVSSDSMVMQFEMKLVDGHLKGDAKAERNGQKMNAAVDFTKAK